jgi:hypothetical protein
MARIELVGSEYNPNLEAEGEAAGAAPKAGGVRGRLQAAANRLRGKKAAPAAEEGEATEKKAAPKRAAKKAKKDE